MGKVKLKIFTLLSTTVLALTAIAPFLVNGLASAAAVQSGDSFSWKNYSVITDTTKKIDLLDGNPTDSTHSFSYSSTDGKTCDNSGVTYGNAAPLHSTTVGSAIIDIQDMTNLGKGKLYIVGGKTVNQGTSSTFVCTVGQGVDITIKAVASATAQYMYVSSSTITSNSATSTTTFKIVLNSDPLYTNTTNIGDSTTVASSLKNKKAYTDQADGCRSYIAVDPNGPGTGTYYSFGLVLGSSTPCTFIKSEKVTIANTAAFNKDDVTKPSASDTWAGTGSSSTGSSEDADSCSAAIPVLGWIICPVANLVSGFANFVDDIISSLLKIDTAKYTSNEHYRTAWSAIRILSTIVLVGIALFMIIAQIFNFDAVSAYTVKKIVPRLAIAIILIQLSWFLATTFIDIINLLGAGIGELIAAPFGGIEKINHFSNVVAEWSQAAGAGSKTIVPIFMGVGLAAGIGAIGGGFGVLALAIGVLIASIIAFVTLVLRQVIVVALILIAPLAVAAWILPNTQSWWNKYWGLATKLLLMYPIIMGLLVVGKVFAFTVAGTPVDGGLQEAINFFVVFIAYFGPLFLIPSLIKASGTIFAKAAEGISKAGWKLKESRPIKRVEEARKHNIEARDYNAKRRGREWIAGQGRVGKLPGGKYIGRYWAGTAGSKGAAAQQLRGLEEQQALKDAELEVMSSTSGEPFPAKVVDMEKIATATIGQEMTTTAGQRVKVSESNQRFAASFLAKTAKADEVRRVLEYMDTNNPELASKVRDDNAGTLLTLAPDTMYKKFEDLRPDVIAQMDESSWRNMSSYVSNLHSQGQTEKVQHIQSMLQEAVNNPELSKYLTFEKKQRLTEMMDPVSPGRKVQYAEIKDKDRNTVASSRVNYAGRTADIVDEQNQAVVNPEYRDSNGRNRNDPGFNDDDIKRF